MATTDDSCTGDNIVKLLFAIAALLAALSAQAHITIFNGSFAPEAPGATGNGSLYLEYENEGDVRTLYIDARWSGLSGTTTNAHIHCCTASPNTGTAGIALATAGMLPGFPLGDSFGSYTRVIDLLDTSSYGAAFVAASGGTAAAAADRLIANLDSGNAYFNIHTSTFGGGEIRAFVAAVPEPSTYAMLLAGLGAVAGVALRRRGN